MDSTKRVALYSRYSTNAQDGNYSIEIQTERMEAMCASKGWVVGDYFNDAAYSGANMDRPDLQNLLNRLDEFDVIMVYRLDRLSRSQRDTMELIQDYFLKNDKAFVSVSETLDTTTPFGMAMIGILAVFAELERATITERMQSGIQKRIEAGFRQLGGNHMPTGYKKGPNSTMVIDDPEAEKVQRIFDLYEKHHSITIIQKVLKEEGYASRRFTTIRQILSNRLYIGKVSYKENEYEGAHDRIISDEQFNRVQILLSRHPAGRNAGKARESLFGSLTHCGKCNEIYMTYSYKVKNQTIGDYYVRSYLCRARRFPSEYDEKCFNKIVKNDIVEALFKSELQSMIKERRRSVVTPKHKKNYELAIRKVDEKIGRLIDLYSEGDIEKDVLSSKIEKLNVEKKDLITKQSTEEQSASLNIDLDELDSYVIDFDKLEFSEKRAIVEKVIDRIIIEDNSIIFEWNF
ncbi:recombinase family protein [Sporosarcina sp. CAU 1771]